MRADNPRKKARTLATLFAFVVVSAAARKGPKRILQAIEVDRYIPAVVHTSGKGIL